MPLASSIKCYHAHQMQIARMLSIQEMIPKQSAKLAACINSTTRKDRRIQHQLKWIIR